MTTEHHWQGFWRKTGPAWGLVLGDDDGTAEPGDLVKVTRSDGQVSWARLGDRLAQVTLRGLPTTLWGARRAGGELRPAEPLDAPAPPAAPARPPLVRRAGKVLDQPPAAPPAPPQAEPDPEPDPF